MSTTEQMSREEMMAVLKEMRWARQVKAEFHGGRDGEQQTAARFKRGALALETAIETIQRLETEREGHQSSPYMSVSNPIQDLITSATLYIESCRLGWGVAATDGSQDWRGGAHMKALGQAVDDLQRDALTPKEGEKQA